MRCLSALAVAKDKGLFDKYGVGVAIEAVLSGEVKRVNKLLDSSTPARSIS
jgi:hypothetical protein